MLSILSHWEFDTRLTRIRAGSQSEIVSVKCRKKYLSAILWQSWVQVWPQEICCIIYPCPCHTSFLSLSDKNACMPCKLYLFNVGGSFWAGRWFAALFLSRVLTSSPHISSYLYFSWTFDMKMQFYLAPLSNDASALKGFWEVKGVKSLKSAAHTHISSSFIQTNPQDQELSKLRRVWLALCRLGGVEGFYWVREEKMDRQVGKEVKVLQGKREKEA